MQHPQAGSFHIVVVDVRPLEDPRLFAKAWDVIDDSRRERISRFRFEEHKRLSLGAGVLLRSVLEANRPVFDGDYPEIGYSAYGKPYLKAVDGFHYNLSHAGTMAALGWGTRPLGVDIERRKPMDMAVMHRFFFPEEAAHVLEQPDEERRLVLFFRYWTLKESLMKQVGTGLNLGPETFSLYDRTWESDHPVSLVKLLSLKDDEPRLFYFHSYPDAVSGYECAFCTEAPAAEPSLEILPIEALISG